jgi:hypothetical protein
MKNNFLKLVGQQLQISLHEPVKIYQADDIYYVWDCQRYHLRVELLSEKNEWILIDRVKKTVYGELFFDSIPKELLKWIVVVNDTLSKEMQKALTTIYPIKIILPPLTLFQKIKYWIWDNF